MALLSENLSKNMTINASIIFRCISPYYYVKICHLERWSKGDRSNQEFPMLRHWEALWEVFKLFLHGYGCVRNYLPRGSRIILTWIWTCQKLWERSSAVLAYILVFLTVFFWVNKWPSSSAQDIHHDESPSVTSPKRMMTPFAPDGWTLSVQIKFYWLFTASQNFAVIREIESHHLINILM